jgi:maltose alpha-D-glucosyltransferase/alpha-amylase
MHNLASEPREVEFATGLKEGSDDRLISLLSDDHSSRLPDGKHRVCLEGYGYRWYRIGGLDYLLKRSEF